MHVLVLGAGFGGLTFCKRFKSKKAFVTVVDRTNHHLFQPLLYQVATAGLAAPDIAQPIRSVLSPCRNLEVLLDEVCDFDLINKRVVLRKKTLSYNYLVLAMGGVTSYFGHPEWKQFAPGLKTLSDALEMRNQILLAFERAESESNSQEQLRLMTIVIVGGGPTGVELAGACAELASHVLQRDFRHIDLRRARVILIEAAPRVLMHLPPDLSESARQQLLELGVEVRTSSPVKNITRGCVELENGEMIQSENIVWAAGVSATELTHKLEKFGIQLDRSGRIKVSPDLSLPGHPEVFAIGDMALVLGEDGKPVPGVSPAAMQMARYVAKIIESELDSEPGKAERPPFRYKDRGTMSTIGRSAAVALIGSVKMHGYPAWLAWLFVHLIYLIGFRNKLVVLLNWVYSYFTYKLGARVITTVPEQPELLAGPNHS